LLCPHYDPYLVEQKKGAPSGAPFFLRGFTGVGWDRRKHVALVLQAHPVLERGDQPIDKTSKTFVILKKEFFRVSRTYRFKISTNQFIRHPGSTGVNPAESSGNGE